VPLARRVAGENGASPEGERSHRRPVPSGRVPPAAGVSWTCPAGRRPAPTSAWPCRPRSTGRPTRMPDRTPAHRPVHTSGQARHTEQASRTTGTPWTTDDGSCCRRRGSCCSRGPPRGSSPPSRATRHESWRDLHLRSGRGRRPGAPHAASSPTTPPKPYLMVPARRVGGRIFSFAGGRSCRPQRWCRSKRR